MSQIFPRSFDLLLRVSLVGVLCFVVGLILLWRMTTAPALGASVVQPIPFSHKHHVGDVGLDCRYCHAAVEEGAYAGMPTSSVCMNCHSQLFVDAPVLALLHDSVDHERALRWNRVTRLPDFVYFNHAIHVTKGIGCVSCHGRVDQMPLTALASPLTMQWCLDCHRNPLPSLRTADRVFSMQDEALPEARRAELARANHLRSSTQLSDCSTCHR
jgi:hypothetical protein